jgi:hypothetical protein
VCGNSKMRISMIWQVHEQAKQCNWLIEMKLTLTHRLALDSWHSHCPNLKESHHLFSYSVS